jgi:hypothetical protein
MNLLDTLRGLARRWYVVIPGIVLALAAALGAWKVVGPEYERTATVLLLPGVGTLPEDALNPYLYLGGLTAVADVAVRAVGSEEALRPVLEPYPGAKAEVARDASTAGPVIVITVTTKRNADAKELVGALVENTSTALDELQTSENIALEDRVTVTPISIDSMSTAEQRNRILVSAGVGLTIIVLTLVAASLIDGLATRSTRRPPRNDPTSDTVPSDVADTDAQRVDLESQPLDVRSHTAVVRGNSPSYALRSAASDDKLNPNDE